MAELKKISELKPSQVNDNTEFLLIDESLGKTNRVSFSSLKDFLVQTGEKGKQGDVGEKGIIGQKGPKGFKGISANKGQKGFSGSEGDSGERGIKGAKGVKGVKGVKGNPISSSSLVQFKGDRGQPGEIGQGQPGLPGDKGSAVSGAKGDIGSQGQIGENAIKGAKGPKGRKGVKGISGDRGSNASSALVGDGGAKGSKSNVAGPKGVQGAKGVGGMNMGYKFNFYHDQARSSVTHGYRFTEGSTLPSYSNDTFYHNNSASSVKMRGSNNRFQKIAGGNAWNGGLKSRFTKSTNKGAWGLTIVPHIAQQTTMYGLSLNPTADFHTLDYAFYFSNYTVPGYGLLTIREKGVQQAYGEETGKMHGIDPNTQFIYLFTPGMQYHIDWDGVNKKIIYRVSNNLTGEIWTARMISCPWVNKNVYAAACFYQSGNSSSADATRYLLWR